MEIDSLNKLYRKYFIYGSSRRKYSHIVYVRPLTNWERFIVFSRTVQKQRYSWIKSAFLLGLLAMGLVYWVSGSVSATWNLKPRLGNRDVESSGS
jgi:hypothetical protein